MESKEQLERLKDYIEGRYRLLVKCSLNLKKKNKFDRFSIAYKEIGKLRKKIKEIFNDTS